MSRIIPVPLLSLLTARSLEQLVCGMETIDVEILKKVVRSVVRHMGESFRINPEFRILRLTFHRSQPQNAELGRESIVACLL